MTSNDGKPVTDDVVRAFLPFDLAAYSMWMPGDPSTGAITCTTVDPVCTYDEIIEPDDVRDACVAYLLRAGVPAFRDAKVHRSYTSALEAGLRQGLDPAQARELALRETGGC